MTRDEMIEAMAAGILAEFDGGASGLDEMAASVARAHARAALAALEAHAAVVPRSVIDQTIGWAESTMPEDQASEATRLLRPFAPPKEEQQR